MPAGTHVPTNLRCSVDGHELDLSSLQNSFSLQNMVDPGPLSQSVGGEVSTNSCTWALKSLSTAARRAAAGTASVTMMEVAIVNLTILL
jgi:hypothetical protein